MLNNEAVYKKVKNLYGNVKSGDIDIVMAIRRIRAIFANSHNEDVEPYLVNWDNFVEIKPKVRYLRKLTNLYPHIQHEEYKFENEVLKMNPEAADYGARKAKIQMRKDIKDLHLMPCRWVQPNGKTGDYEPAQASGLDTLLHDLKVNIKEDQKLKKTDPTKTKKSNKKGK